MKIAIVSHLKFPIVEPFKGGLEMHTHLLAKALIENGHEVVTYAAKGSDPALNLRVADDFADPKDRPVAPERMYGNTAPNASREHHIYRRIMLDIKRERFDVVHNNSLHYIPMAMVDQIGCPMITVLHTPPFDSMSNSARQAARFPHKSFVSISDHTTGTWAPFIDRAPVVHNGIDADSWTFSAEPAAAKIAIWMGRICPEKSPHLAIYAAIKAGYHLHLAGSIYDQIYFEDMVEPWLDHPMVHFLGHQTHTQLSKRIGQASVGLFTSTWDEPFGLVLPEMLACGTPIVAFDSGAAREIVDETCGIVVPKGDVSAMAAAIPQAIQKCRKSCRQRVLDRFTHGHMIAGYERGYRAAIARYRADKPAILPLTGITSQIANVG